VASTRTFTVLKNVDGVPIILDIHDGDTFVAELDVADEVGHHPALRVRGLYCPELGEDGGLAAWLFTAQTLRKAKDITATLHGRSFARFLATILVDGQNLADLVIAAGHGKATPS
jgi:endonuclease YncB( thermonuclease family)